jgi:hypothetical protein
VLTVCPETGVTIPTFAVMTAKELSKQTGAISFWCSACRQAHHAPSSSVWLETLRSVDEQANGDRQNSGPEQRYSAERSDAIPSNMRGRPLINTRHSILQRLLSALTPPSGQKG